MLTLVEYEPRQPGTEAAYTLLEQAVVMGRAQGRWRQAARAVEQAIEQFVALRDRQGEHRARAKAAIIFRHMGETQRAREQATQALHHFEAAVPPEPHFYATAALELGQLLDAQGEFEEALDTYARALKQLAQDTRPSDDAELALTRARLQDCMANVYAQRGDFVAAAPLRQLALKAFEAHAVRIDAVTTLCNIAKDAFHAGQLGQALEPLTRAQAHLGNMNDPHSSAQAEEVLFALARQLQQKATPAERPGWLELVRTAGWNTIRQFDAASNRLRGVQARLNLAAVELQHGNLDAAMPLLEAAAQRLPAEDDAAAPDEAPLKRRLDALRGRYFVLAAERDGRPVLPRELLDHPGVEVSVRVQPEPGAPNRPQLPAVEQLVPFFWVRLDARRALQEVERVKSTDLLRMLQWHQSPPDQPLVDEASAGLPDALEPLALEPAEFGGLREAFVDYYCCDERILAFVQTPGAPVECVQLDVTADEVLETVSSLRERFDGGGARMGIVRNHPFRVGTDAIDRLGARLLPFLDRLAGADIVSIFPSGPLAQFPFQAVRDINGEPWLARFAMAFGLSRRIVAGLRRQLGRKPGTAHIPSTAAVVAVPADGERHPELYFGDGALLSALGLQVRTLESAVNATLAGVVDAMQAPELLHFSCHGEFDAAHPLESALLMADGERGPALPARGAPAGPAQRLDARRIFGLRLKAQTVVLRACSSGVTRVREGDEQEGLLRAFINAGVGCCLVARWKVDVESSGELVREFYRHWIGGGLPRAVALQRAQLQLMRRAEPTFYRHPYHWAPFALVGDWW